MDMRGQPKGESRGVSLHSETRVLPWNEVVHRPRRPRNFAWPSESRRSGIYGAIGRLSGWRNDNRRIFRSVAAVSEAYAGLPFAARLGLNADEGAGGRVCADLDPDRDVLD